MRSAPDDNDRSLAEGERLAAVRDVLTADKGPGGAFDRLTAAAAELLGVGVSLVSLVDEDHQTFAGATGLAHPWSDVRETPLSHSFCRHIVESGASLVVEDALLHPLVSDNLAIRDLDVRAYAGVPVCLADGHVLGALCAIEARPRRWSAAELRVLEDLAVVAGELAELRRRTARMDLRDPLTGLVSRDLFEELVTEALRRGTPDRRDLAVVAVGLDGFRLVNEALGHRGGDEVLRQVAGRIAGAVRDDDRVTRVAGDEFLVMVQRARSGAEIRALAERVRRAIGDEVFTVDGEHHAVSATLGVAVPEADACAAELMAAALDDLAREKAGSGTAVPSFPTRVVAGRRLRLRSAIGGAVERGELSIAYQPLIALTRGRRTIGYEALLRWEHPELGTVSPADFIPAAERFGDIVPIGEWVLRTGCEQLARWRAERDPDLALSVNVAPIQLASAAFAPTVARVLHETGVPASALELEITERTLIDGRDVHAHSLGALRRLGVRLAVDDFGTGFSALSVLTRFELDTLKIDRSFVAQMACERRSATLVQAIIAMADSLGMTTVAEGVETASQAARLEALGCPVGQGYFFGRPAPAEAVPPPHAAVA